MKRPSSRAGAAVFAVAVAGVMVPLGGSAEASSDGDKQVYIVQTTGTDRAAASADPSRRAAAVRAAYGVSPRTTYRAALSGFTASMTPQQAAALERRGDVVKVVPNSFVENVIDTPPASTAKKSRAASATWGLDRIDQRQLPLDSTYSTTSTGSGVTAYVIDTGVNPAHPDFGGRATQAVNFAGGRNEDCNGHGTHVGGTIGSTTYGVAKGVEVVGVKAFTCLGGTSTEILLNSLDWVTENAQAPAVVNTSWQFTDPGGILQSAVERMDAAGIFHATAAGNSGRDNCTGTVPRNSALPLVVGNSTSTDDRYVTSSTGACVDVYAPGTDIVSLDNDGEGTAVNTGTSMASPHAAGVGALYLQQNPDATPAEVKQWIEDSATPDVVKGGETGGTVNRLLFTNGL